MKDRLIEEKDFSVSAWSGGKTKELFILPEGSNFKDRNFKFRISSATFTGTESEFSDFSNYQRYILPLRGELSVDHKNLYKRNLKTYEVEYFSGSWNTFSTNSSDCVDFNFIVRDGSFANLCVMSDSQYYIPKRNGILMFYSEEKFELSINDGETIKDIDGGNLYIIYESEEIYKTALIASDKPVVVCEFS